MLKLKSLKFKNIGRFVEEQTIDFFKLGPLSQVDGQNKNTNGSSGAGKSTIFQALEFLLGLNDTPVTILQSRLTKEGIWVEGEFDLDGVPVVISRDKKLSVKVGEDETKGSNKLAEEKLDLVLGMPRSLFRVIAVKRQKEGGFFLNFTPKQTHEFLVDAKGLKAHADKALKIDLDYKTLEGQLQLAESNRQAAESGLQSTKDALLTIGEPPSPSAYDKTHIAELQNYLSTHTELLGQYETTQNSQKHNLFLEKPKTSFTPFDRSQINAIEKERSELVSLTNELERKEKARQSAIKDQINALRIKSITAKAAMEKGEKAKLEAIRIMTELKKLREGSCPTCEQVWVTDLAKAKDAQLLAAFEVQKAIIVAGAEQAPQVAEFDKQIETFTPELTPIYPLPEMKEISLKSEKFKLDLAFAKGYEIDYNLQQNEANKKANDDYLAKVNALAAQHAAELSVLKNEISKASQALNAATMDFKSASMSASRYKTTLDGLNAQAEKHKLILSEADKSLLATKETMEIVAEAKLLVKSFISCSFDDALESIGDKATQIIRGIPNMANATVQLEGVRETKEGKVKEEVTAVLHNDGEEGVPVRSLSGGERSALDLAIDLAVIDFLEDETGKGLDIFILDEPFTGLGAIEIEPILELLQSSNLNKKIIVVDHNEIVKQHVQSKILVVRNGDVSNIVEA
jgi:DNA repair exonuclease SbcCD ATPase subunit